MNWHCPRALSVLLLSALVGCSSSSAGDSASTSAAPASASARATGSAIASSRRPTVPPSSSDRSTLDPLLAPAIGPILDCKWESRDGRTWPTSDCKADGAWSGGRVELKSPAENVALFEMLVSGDPRLSYLASERYPSDAGAALSDKAQLERLFTAMEATKDGNVRRRMVEWLSLVDAEKLGLADRLWAIAKGSNEDLRQDLASSLLPNAGFHQKAEVAPIYFQVIESLASNDGHGFRSTIAETLAHNATPPACAILEKAMTKEDSFAGVVAAEVVTYEKNCPGLDAKGLDWIDKKTQNLQSLDDDQVSNSGTGIYRLCHFQPGSPLVPKARELMDRMLTAKGASGRIRSAGVRALAVCEPDPEKAKARITPFLQDKDVKDTAARELKELEEKKKEK